MARRNDETKAEWLAKEVTNAVNAGKAGVKRARSYSALDRTIEMRLLYGKRP